MRPPPSLPELKRPNWGRGNTELGRKKYIHTKTTPLRLAKHPVGANLFADLGEPTSLCSVGAAHGREGGNFSPGSIANSLYIQFDIFENAMELVGFRYVHLMEHFDN